MNSKWKTKPLGSFVTDGFQNGLYRPASDYGSGVPIVRINDFDNHGRFNGGQLERLQISGAELSRFELQQGDILINRVNSLTHIGKSALVPTLSEHMVYESNMMRLRLNACELDASFLAQYLLLNRTREFFRRVAKRAVAQCSINQDDVKSLHVPAIPLPEQQKIAAILSTWDRAIELTEKQIAARERRKQALMQQLLTGKVRFTEFEGRPWKQVRLGKVLKEVKRFVEWDDDAQYHLLSIRRRSGGMFDRETKYGRDIKTKVMMTTEAGDFVIARMQAVHGAIAMTPPGCHGKHVSGSYSTFVVKDKNLLHMPFLNYLSQTRSFYQLLLQSAYGVTIEKMTFNLPWFLSEKITLPPSVEEQQRIADVFVAHEDEQRLFSLRLNSLKQQKKGLMQQLLTGKTRTA